MPAFFGHLISKYNVRRPVTRPEDGANEAIASARRANTWHTASVSGEEKAVQFRSDSYAVVTCPDQGRTQDFRKGGQDLQGGPVAPRGPPAHDLRGPRE